MFVLSVSLLLPCCCVGRGVRVTWAGRGGSMMLGQSIVVGGVCGGGGDWQ